MVTKFDVYLEIGSNRAFASAVDWPGWCRHAPNESDALAELVAYGPKYEKVLSGTRLGFTAPTDTAGLKVVERLKGNATTDFGAIAIPPAGDHDRDCDAASLKRFEKILRAGWRAFDAAAQSARGKTLTTGKRGGGRSLEAIIAHVIDADIGYLGAVGWKLPKLMENDDRLAVIRAAILEAMHASAAGGIAPQGPRGGMRWTARYFVRRVAWHEISHAWEIERRAILQG